MGRNKRMLDDIRNRRLRSEKKLDTWYDKHPDVLSFYQDIAPEIRKRELGVDRLTDDEMNAFRDLKKIKVRYVPGYEKDTGMYSPGRNAFPWQNPLAYLYPVGHETVRLGQQYDESTLVHELRHALARRMSTSQNAQKNLDDTYRFMDMDNFPFGWLYQQFLGREEEATTNKQHQFRAYVNLKHKLGRKPSADEYFEYVKGMNKADLLGMRTDPVNGYQIYADDDQRKKMIENAKILPGTYQHTVGKDIPSWAVLVPKSKGIMESGRNGDVKVVHPIEEIYDKSEDLEKYRKGLMEISMNQRPDGNEKKADIQSYTRNFGIGGSLAGGGLAAALSAIYYSRKNQKKKPFATRFLKGLLWTGLGAFGGGVSGALLGRMIGAHVIYKRSLDAARKRLEEGKVQPKKGRVMYLNYPDNRYQFENGSLPSKILPKGAPIQHAALVTMESDGGNAKIYHLGALNKKDIYMKGKALIQRGISTDDNKMLTRGIDLISKPGMKSGLWMQDLGDRLKGKDDEFIRQFFADIGSEGDMGNVVEVYEGNKNADINIVQPFLEEFFDRNNGSYNILLGGLNCGTNSRAGFDSAQPRMSHYLDMMWGGYPSANAPSMASKSTGKSYLISDRKNLAYGYIPGKDIR